MTKQRGWLCVSQIFPRKYLFLVLELRAWEMEDSSQLLLQLPVVSDSGIVDVHPKDGKVVSICKTREDEQHVVDVHAKNGNIVSIQEKRKSEHDSGVFMFFNEFSTKVIFFCWCVFDIFFLFRFFNVCMSLYKRPICTVRSCSMQNSKCRIHSS